MTTSAINNSAMITPKPLQLVSLDNNADEDNFKFNEESLNFVLSQIPPGCRIAIISVVGGFRTGKSFLLNWFMQYLSHYGSEMCSKTLDDDGNEFEAPKWYECVPFISKEEGFQWSGGEDRITAGIWLWSKPFFLTSANGNMAVLMLDTQG